jgi:predicted AAA+ superfamily ATPase
MDVFRTLAANPERLGELIEGSGGTGIVVLDEIQKAPALLDEVHSLMERHKKIRFILTGSTARKWKGESICLPVAR